MIDSVEFVIQKCENGVFVDKHTITQMKDEILVVLKDGIH